MLIRVTKLRTFLSNKSVYVNTAAIKYVLPVGRNYSEDCADIHLLNGEVIKTNCYIGELQKAMEK